MLHVREIASRYLAMIGNLERINAQSGPKAIKARLSANVQDRQEEVMNTLTTRMETGTGL